MKVLNQDVQDVVVLQEQQDDDGAVETGKGRTDVQDILAGNDESSCRAASPCAASRLPGISCVLGGRLLLCGANACRPCDLRACGVTCVVSAAHELPDTPLPHADTLYLRVPVRDAPHEDLARHFDAVADVIEQVRMSGGCTLVHCVAGVSRSAALCLAYLMREQRLSLYDAFHFLRSKRPQIRPNTGFFRQLIAYEERLFGKTSVKMVFNEAAGKEIPDVYEPDYREMLWYRQRHCLTSRY